MIVTQKRPEVACNKTGRLASSAKPNSTRTRPAKGTTWPNVTRERHSIWRSFVATSQASRSIVAPGSRLPRSSEVMVPPATVRWRVARSSVRSSSCEASITVAPADAASRMTWSIRSRPP